MPLLDLMLDVPALTTRTLGAEFAETGGTAERIHGIPNLGISVGGPIHTTKNGGRVWAEGGGRGSFLRYDDVRPAFVASSGSIRADIGMRTDQPTANRPVYAGYGIGLITTTFIVRSIRPLIAPAPHLYVCAGGVFGDGDYRPMFEVRADADVRFDLWEGEFITQTGTASWQANAGNAGIRVMLGVEIR